MNIGESNLVGKCLEMCPDEEAENHKNSEISGFENDPITHKFSKKYAITNFHRSTQEFNEKNIRPLPILQKTMKHILQHVIGKQLKSSDENTDEIHLYLYLRGRFRAMCTDITVQHLEGEEVIDLYQTMILFFIWSGARFPNDFDIDSFDTFMNNKVLTQIFDLLDKQYILFFRKTRIHHPFEADFRAFDLLLHISDDDGQFMSKLLVIPTGLLQTIPIQNVLKIRQAVISRNIPEFLKVIDSTTIQFGVMALQNIPDLYLDTFLATKKTFRNFKFNKDFFTVFLDLPNEYFRNFAQGLYIDCDSNDPKGSTWSFELNIDPNPKNCPRLPLPLDIKRRFDRSPILDFLVLKPTPSTILTLPPKPESSITVQNENLDENEKSEEEQNFNEEDANHDEEIEIPQIKPEKASDENVTPQITEFIPIELKPPQPKPFVFKKIEPPVVNEEKQQNIFLEQATKNQIEGPPLSPVVSQKFDDNQYSEDEDEEKPIPFKCIIKMTKKYPKPKLFIFTSMVPPDLPPFCFISVVVNDSDGSPSAEFARKCFSGVKTASTNPLNKKNYIIYLGDSKMPSSICKRSHVYIAIVRKQIQKHMNSVGAILNCEDTESYEAEVDGEVPIFTFSLADSTNSPELILNNKIRKCIQKAVVEFKPTNLTELIETALGLSFQIVLSPKWQRSSCNAVLSLFNNVLSTLANELESESFMRYLLPFIHNEFGPKNMKEFSTSIRKMRFTLIEKEESIKPQLDSTWPIFIHDSMKITSIRPFIAPVSEKFDPQEFLANIIGPFEKSLPFEYILPSKEEGELSYNNILHAFDCDLYE